jgi:hypothetical protein
LISTTAANHICSTTGAGRDATIVVGEGLAGGRGARAGGGGGG